LPQFVVKRLPCHGAPLVAFETYKDSRFGSMGLIY
jgi:hypothetical protein